MSENQIFISIPQKSNNVKVSANVSNENINVSKDTSSYWANIAKNWAINMDGKILNEDFSSKYYALQSKSNADDANISAQNAQNISDSMDNHYITYTEELNQIKSAAIDDITTLYDSSYESISTLKNESVTEITNQKGESLTEIGNAQTDAVSDINTSKDSALLEIQEKIELGCLMALPLFSPVIMDHILSYEESLGYALQGTYVYSTAIAGERYGYPTFVKICINEKNAGTPATVSLGGSDITIWTNANGHQFYDIADKSIVDAFFNTFGVADYYGVDETNSRVFLPRNNYFMQLTTNPTDVNKFTPAGLPALTTNSTGAHTHTRGTMDIIGKTRIDAWSGSTSGCFYRTTEGIRKAGTGSDSGSEYSMLYFQASKNWTGATSSNGAHTHTIAGTADTVQPPSSKKLLYYVVGNTLSDTAWIDVVTDVEGAVKDIVDEGDKQVARIQTAGEDYVKKSGDTMTGTLNIETPTGGQFVVTNSTKAYTDEANDEYLNINFGNYYCRDKNGQLVGAFETFKDIAGSMVTRINTFGPNGKWASMPLQLVVDKNGIAKADAPTPATTSNATEIATTAWTLAHSAFPSSKYTELKFVDGSQYTAPADGWFSIFFSSIKTTGNVHLGNVTKKIYTEATSSKTTLGAGAYVPANKGDKIYAYSGITATSIKMYFVYANGRS